MVLPPHRAELLLALVAAAQGGMRGEVPIGAVLVDPLGREVARAANAVESESDPSAHAEIGALRQAARHQKNFRLDGTRMTVTVNPCPMCRGALELARVRCVTVLTDRTGDLGEEKVVINMAASTSPDSAVAASMLLGKFFEPLRGPKRLI